MSCVLVRGDADCNTQRRWLATSSHAFFGLQSDLTSTFREVTKWARLT